MSINININITNLLRPLIKGEMDRKRFNTRNSLNLEKSLFLTKNKLFMADIALAKSKFNVPKLNPENDYIFINSLETPIEDSSWLSSQSNKLIEEWEEHIKSILIKYSLPASFKDWVEWEVLYGKPNFYPHYNVEALLEIIRNPLEASRICLTSSEKEFFLTLIKFVINSNQGKRKSALKKSYPLLKKAITQSKNTQRRSRVLKTALKTLNMGKKKTYYDYSIEESEKRYITHKTTSKDLATSIFKDDTGKKSALVRQQKERLLKRHI